MSRFSQSIHQYVYGGLHLNQPRNGESVEQSHENDCGKPFDDQNTTMNEANPIEAVYEPAITTAESSSSQIVKPGAVVSQAFLSRFMDIFMESVGPVAPFIVGHHIGLLGESRETFPKSRIGELTRSIAPEISQPEVRLRFETKIAAEIRNLEDD